MNKLSIAPNNPCVHAGVGCDVLVVHACHVRDRCKEVIHEVGCERQNEHPTLFSIGDHYPLSCPCKALSH
jgi:hypothetical protein